jgi:ankyrin repeat protein
MAPKKTKGAPSIFDACEDDDAAQIGLMVAADVALLETRNKDGWTPLLAASYYGSAVAVEKLLSLGACVTAVCNDRDGAAHYASAQGNGDVLKLLAAAKAPLDKEDNDGETPAMVAQNPKIRKLVEKLVEEAQAAAEEDEEGEGEGGDDEGDEEEKPAA